MIQILNSEAEDAEFWEMTVKQRELPWLMIKGAGPTPT